jgi:MFS family permease
MTPARADTMPAGRDMIAFAGINVSHVWLMIGVLFLCTLLVQGMSIGGIVMFDDRVMSALGISRSVLKFRDLIYIFTSSITCLFIAPLCERVGARWLVMAGLLSLSGVMVGYAYADNILLIYACQALLGFAYSCVHVVVLLLILTRWFGDDIKKRAVALGICVSGASGGAVLLSQMIARLLAQMPWRDVFLVLAVLPLLMLAPVWLTIRTPRDARRGDWRARIAGSRGFSFGMLASTPAIVMVIAVVPIFYVSTCAATHTVLMLRDQGLPTVAAANGLSAMFTAGLVGKFGSGFLVLRLRLYRSWLLMLALMIAGSLLLLAAPRTLYVPALMLIGLGWGGAFPLAQLQIGEIFPGDALTRVLGAFVVIESIGSAGGAWLTAVMYDRLGSYAGPFAFNVALLASGVIATIVVHRMTRRPDRLSAA